MKGFDPSFVLHELPKNTSHVKINENPIRKKSSRLIIDHHLIEKMQSVTDAEIQRYQDLYSKLDAEYQTFKKHTHDKIQVKDESFLIEIAQHQKHVSQLQSQMADLRKNQLLIEQEKHKILHEKQDLIGKLEMLHNTKTSVIEKADINDKNMSVNSNHIPHALKQIEDNRNMKEIIIHQTAQIQVLMNTIDSLQLHKPKKSHIIEITSRLAANEAMENQRKIEFENMKSSLLKYKCANDKLSTDNNSLQWRLNSLQLKMKNIEQMNEKLCTQFEHSQREILEKNGEIHELELNKQRLQTIRKQLESQLTLTQSELHELNDKHFKHLQNIGLEHQMQIKKLTQMTLSVADHEQPSMNCKLGCSQTQNFEQILLSLTQNIEKYLLQKQSSTEFFCSKNKMSADILNSTQEKHHFIKQLINIVNNQYIKISANERQLQYYEWLSRYNSQQRHKIEVNLLSVQYEHQICKKHFQDLKSDHILYEDTIHESLKEYQLLVQQQMRKSIEKYLMFYKELLSIKTQLKLKTKECKECIMKYETLFVKNMDKNVDKNVDNSAQSAKENEHELKNYLHTYLTKIIQQTIECYSKNDLNENQIFQLSNEILTLKYVQIELIQNLEKTHSDLECMKNENEKLFSSFKKINQNTINIKSEVEFEIKSDEMPDINIMQLEQNLHTLKLKNESLKKSIKNLEKENEQTYEKINVSQFKHEQELKHIRTQITKEREILIINHNNEIVINAHNYSLEIESMKKELDIARRRIRPWTDTLDVNQLKHTCEQQKSEISRVNLHLQTLKTKITQLEYKLMDVQKVCILELSLS